MKQIQLTGKFKIENKLVLKDPLVTIQRALYDYEAMTVILTAKFENNQYSHVRELDPFAILDTNGLTSDQVEKILSDNLTLKKTTEPINPIK